MRNVHFILHHAADVDEWPFFKALRNVLTAATVKAFSNEVILHYRYRWQLGTLGYPKLLITSLRTAFQSACHKPSADTLVVEEHLQIWPVVFIYMLTGRYLYRRPQITFLGFLYTERQHWLENHIRRWYFRRVLARVDRVIVFSKSECDWLRTQFPCATTKLRHLHYGIGDHQTTAEYALRMESNHNSKCEPRTRPLRIFSAGRSGRDYKTLIEACELLQFPFSLTIVCDSKDAFPDHLARPWTRVLRNCYQHQYTTEMINSDVIVVPLTESKISSGQMVVMHGLACGKPIVLTGTPTSAEYFADLSSVRLTPTGCSVAMAANLEKINAVASNEITWLQESRDCFENHFSIERYAERVARALTNKASSRETLEPAEGQEDY